MPPSINSTSSSEGHTNKRPRQQPDSGFTENTTAPKKRRIRTVDPVTLEPSTAEDALPYSTARSRQLVDPVTLKPSAAEDALPYSTARGRQLVDPVTLKPSTAEDALPYSAAVKRKLVDPVTLKPSTAKDAVMYNTAKSRRLVDPVTLKPSTAEDAVTYNTAIKRRLVDPVTLKRSTAEDALPYSTAVKRQLVDPVTLKPSTAEDALPYSTAVKRQLVDPVTLKPSTAEDALPYSTAAKRRQRRATLVTGPTGNEKRVVERRMFFSGHSSSAAMTPPPPHQRLSSSPHPAPEVTQGRSSRPGPAMLSANTVNQFYTPPLQEQASSSTPAHNTGVAIPAGTQPPPLFAQYPLPSLPPIPPTGFGLGFNLGLGLGLAGTSAPHLQPPLFPSQPYPRDVAGPMQTPLSQQPEEQQQQRAATYSVPADRNFVQDAGRILDDVIGGAPAFTLPPAISGVAPPTTSQVKIDIPPAEMTHQDAASQTNSEVSLEAVIDDILKRNT